MKKLKPWLISFTSGFGVYLFDKLIGQHINWDLINKIPILKWLTIRVSLYQILIFIIIFILLFIFIKIFWERTKIISYDKDKKKLLAYNQKEIGDLLWKWVVYFDLNGKPKIDKLWPYCTKHDNVPYKMTYSIFSNGYKCPINGCESWVKENTIYGTNISHIKNIVESYVEKEWEEINTRK
jgi:hypothetical protein